MLRIVSLVSVFAFIASVAFAQESTPLPSSPSQDGVGPFKFGMRLADAEATRPNAHWQIEQLPKEKQTLSGALSLAIGASRFGGVLVFDHDALEWIVLNGNATSPCQRVIPALVADMEPSFGVFNAVPGLVERDLLQEVSQTTAGSEIRVREATDHKRSVYSSRRRGAQFIEIQGRSRDEGGCNVSITFARQQDPASDGAVSYDELERAQTLVGPDWTGRPTASSFVRYYPQAALHSNTEGEGVLDCLVNADGSLRCLVAAEEPVGGGFGEAALHISADFRVLRGAGGVSAIGKRLHVPITFRIG